MPDTRAIRIAIIVVAVVAAVLTWWNTSSANAATWQLCWRWNDAYIEAFNPDPVEGCIDSSSPRSGLVTDLGDKVIINDYWSSDAGWTRLTVNGFVIFSPWTAVKYPLDTIAVQDDTDIVATATSEKPVVVAPMVRPKNPAKLKHARYGHPMAVYAI
jgi:hypothetical protein